MSDLAKPASQAGRLSEIERDLKQHYSKCAIDVLGTWQHRGNVELYFKHRYKQFNYRIGKLTEYYRFKDVESVLEDLFSMQPKILEGQELVIWSDNELAFISSLLRTSNPASV